MNKKIPKYLKLTFAASILGTSLLTGFPTNAYAEDTLTVLDVNATQNGWSLQDGTWYYYKNGILLTNTWITSGGQYYYLGEDGSMQTNTWIGNDYVDSNGVWLTNYQPAKWMQTNGKWWYRNEDGSYPANTWKKINNNWYYFDSAGYLITNDWKKVGGS